MASGNKRMKINTRERLVSTDHNRLQAFEGAQVAEIMRWMLTAFSSETGAAPSIVSTTSNPLFGVIVNGLWARPEIGTTNLFVEAGVIGMVNPDASPSSDDSPFKIWADSGQPLAGALTLTPGAVATRVDVIECSRVTVVTESDNRDIFNPTTQLFTPVLVDKVEVEQLVFRIRTGTPGGGFAGVGTASGWMPLAVAVVPSTATTWDDVTVWDVRRLMIDFVRAPAMVSQQFPQQGKSWSTAHELAGVRTLRGWIDTQLGDSRMGGELAPSNSGLAGGALDLLSTEVLEAGFAAASNAPWGLYFVAPHSLPRWARYTPASSGLRIPMARRGIPVFTQKMPTSHRGQPSAAISIPTDLGLGGSSTNAVIGITGGFGSGGTFISSVTGGGWTRLSGPPAVVSPASGAGTGSVRYDLADNTHWPVGATAVRLRFKTQLSAVAGTAADCARAVQQLDGSGNILTEDLARFTLLSPTGGVLQEFFEIEVPLHCFAGMPNGTNITRQFNLSHTVAVFTFAAQNCQVMGWRMGQ